MSDALWGPAPPAPAPAPADGDPGVPPGGPVGAVKHPKPWGGFYALFWFVGALVVSQIALLFAVVALMAAQGNLAMGTTDDVLVFQERLTETLLSGPGLAAALVSQWVVFFGVPALVTRLRGHRSLRVEYGLSVTRSDVAWGVGLGLVLQGLMIGLGWFLSVLGMDTDAASNTGMFTDSAGFQLVLLVVAATVMAPLTEELVFRGLLLRGFLRTFAGIDHAPRLGGVTDRFHDTNPSGLRRRVGVVAAIVVSSVLFGLMHTPTDPSGMGAGYPLLVAQTGLLGAVFAVVAYKSRRLGLPIVAHLVFNSLSVGLVLALG